MDTLEKRLRNTELALLAMWSLMKDTMPPAYQEDIDKMINEYYDANAALGSDFNAELREMFGNTEQLNRGE